MKRYQFFLGLLLGLVIALVVVFLLKESKTTAEKTLTFETQSIQEDSQWGCFCHHPVDGDNENSCDCEAGVATCPASCGSRMKSCFATCPSCTYECGDNELRLDRKAVIGLVE